MGAGSALSWDLFETLLAGAGLLYLRDSSSSSSSNSKARAGELNRLALSVKRGERPLSELAEMLKPVARAIFSSSRERIVKLVLKRALTESGSQELHECAFQSGEELWDQFISALAETLAGWDPSRADFALWISKSGVGRRRLEGCFRRALAQLEAEVGIDVEVEVEAETESAPGGGFEARAVPTTISLDTDGAVVDRLLVEIDRRERERRREQATRLEQFDLLRRKTLNKLELLVAKPELLNQLGLTKRLALREAIDARLRELFQSQLLSLRDLTDRDRRLVSRVLNDCKSVSSRELSDRIKLLLKLERRAERRARWRRHRRRRRRLATH